MKSIDSFKTKGLLSFGNSTWITIEPCIINNCKLDAGTIVFDASIFGKFNHLYLSYGGWYCNQWG